MRGCYLITGFCCALCMHTGPEFTQFITTLVSWGCCTVVLRVPLFVRCCVQLKTGESSAADGPSALKQRRTPRCSNSSSSTIIVAAATNAATRPNPFKPTRPLCTFPARLSASVSLHYANIGSVVMTELCACHTHCLVIGFTRAEQRRPQFCELPLQPF